MPDVKPRDRVQITGVPRYEGKVGIVRYVYKTTTDRFPIQVNVDGSDDDVFCQPSEVRLINEDR